MLWNRQRKKRTIVEGVAGILHNLNIETAGTEEEAAEGLAAALEMEFDEERGSKGEDECGGTLRALGALAFLAQEAEPRGTPHVDAHNGFNELRRLEMLWTVRHRWPAGGGSRSMENWISKSIRKQINT